MCVCVHNILPSMQAQKDNCDFCVDCVSLCAYTHGKDMNPSLLSSVMC